MKRRRRNPRLYDINWVRAWVREEGYSLDDFHVDALYGVAWVEFDPLPVYERKDAKAIVNEVADLYAKLRHTEDTMALEVFARDRGPEGRRVNTVPVPVAVVVPEEGDHIRDLVNDPIAQVWTRIEHIPKMIAAIFDKYEPLDRTSKRAKQLEHFEFDEDLEHFKQRKTHVSIPQLKSILKRLGFHADNYLETIIFTHPITGLMLFKSAIFELKDTDRKEIILKVVTEYIAKMLKVPIKELIETVPDWADYDPRPLVYIDSFRNEDDEPYGPDYLWFPVVTFEDSDEDFTVLPALYDIPEAIDKFRDEVQSTRFVDIDEEDDD